MKLVADYHIHSDNSRFKISKSGVEEIARRANAIGLKQIAITDHGYKHFFGANKQKMFKNREIINQINQDTNSKILLGMEADVLSQDGTIDVDEETLQILDILIIGYHKMIKTDYASFFGRQTNSPEAIEKATDAFVNAIMKYDVDIVAHPNHLVKLDLFRLGTVCAQRDVLIELNNRHLSFSQEDIETLLKTNCKFIVSSDSYGTENMGIVDNALLFIEQYKIPSDRVVNVEFNEKTDIELEVEEDQERYNKILEQKLRKAQKYELSEETENKLSQIADEEGLEFEKNEDVEVTAYDMMTEEERALVRRAQEILKNRKDN